MAFIDVSQARPARTRLAAMRGVTTINNPAPHDPAAVALVFAGIRCIEIRAADAGFSAAIHLRFGQWLYLVDDVAEDVAFAAVAAFIELVASVPQHYAPEHDATERRIAAEVAAAFALPASLPLTA